MLRFKLFLEAADLTHELEPYSGTHRHYAKVGDHDITVRYSPMEDGSSRRKGYEVSFDVNMSSNADHSIHPAHRAAIIHTVKKSVHEIITKHKPQVLFFKGNNDKKHALYGKIAHNFAKKYNGKVEGGGDPSIKMRNNWKLHL